MKKTLILGLMAAIIGFTSCGGSDDDNLGENPSTATTGTATRKGGVSVKWVQLWKDGPKFAEYNLEAMNSKVEDWGPLYSWGGKFDVSPANHSSSGRVLTGDNDTATYWWGSNWRMPRKEEFEALLANCTIEWTTVNGVKGCRFTGKGSYSSNSIFLPAAGYFTNEDWIADRGDYGYYWSSTPKDTQAYYMVFGEKRHEISTQERKYCFPVRPVLAK